MRQEIDGPQNEYCFLYVEIVAVVELAKEVVGSRKCGQYYYCDLEVKQALDIETNPVCRSIQAPGAKPYKNGFYFGYNVHNEQQSDG